MVWIFSTARILTCRLNSWEVADPCGPLRDGLLLLSARATLRPNCSTPRGDGRERRFRTRDQGLQVGWHAADPPGRRAEGHRYGDIRFRHGDARPARWPHPALSAPACAHPLDRHLEGREASGREGGGDVERLPQDEGR